MKVVLITGLKNDFDRELAAAFANAGFKVYAVSADQKDDGFKVYAVSADQKDGGFSAGGIILLPFETKEAAAAVQKESGHIDIYIDTSDERSPSDNFTVRGGLNDDVIRKLYDANVTRPMALLETFLPLLELGEGKRLCFLTSAQASINETRETDGYAYKMAKAALHNFLQITRNALSPKGFTIRAFDPSQNEVRQSRTVSPQAAAQAALNYFVRRRGVERGDERRDDEGNLVFRDAFGRQHAW